MLVSLLINSKTGENSPHHVVVNKNMQRRRKSNKTYICVVCHKEFTTEKNIKIHKQQHYKRDNRGILNCELCPQYYGSKISLIRHYTLKHPPKRVVGDKEFCENSEQTERVALMKSKLNETDSGISGERFLSEAQLTSHIATHHRPYKCELCDQNFFNLVAYEKHTTHCSQQHMKSHNRNKLFSCEICDKRFITKRHLVIHLETHTEYEQLTLPSKRAGTNESDSNIATDTRRKDKKKKVEEHKDVTLPESDPDCIRPSISDVKTEESNEELNKTSPALIGINSKTGENAPHHVVVNKNMQRRPKSNKTYFCVVCHKEITTVKNIKIHKQQHFIRDNRGLLNCEHCPLYYASKIGLMSHYREKHPPKRDVGVIEFCENSVQQRHVLIRNKQLRPKSYKYKVCEVCHKEITPTKNFKIHRQQHFIRDNGGLLKCEHCPQYYASKIGLMSHYREKHPPKRDVGVIEFCENSVQQRDVLIRNKHLRPKSYKYNFCVVCHKEIIPTKNFKIHRQQHFIRDKRGLLKCEHCRQYYASKHGLLSHYREKHPPKRIFGDKEFCENSGQTERVALVESQPNETYSGITTITHTENYIVMKEMVKDKKYNMLLKSEKPAIDREFSEENELAELVASMKSEPSSPESLYVNLENDKFTVGETNVKTEESNAELYNPSPALIGINREMVDNNDDGKVKKKVEEHKYGMYHVILPEPDPDCTVTSIATVAHEKVIQKNSEEQEDFMLSEPDSVDWNVPINDKEFCEQSELSELMGSIKSEASSPKSWKSSQEINSIITNHNHIPEYKGPFKCKRCPKYFALKTNLTRHCRMDHPPK